MATIRGNFAQLIAPAIMEVIFEKLKEFPEEYSQFCEVSSSTAAYDEDQMIAGLGLAKKKEEGEPITYDDPIQGGSKRYIHDSYANGWQVTREMMDDEKYGIMKKIPGELMKGSRQTWEQVGANVLNNGFTTVTSVDGVSLFNTAHPLLGGGTYSNRLNPDSDPSITAFQDICIQYEKMVNERGLKMKLSPDDVWFPPDLQFIMGKIFQSQYEPFTGENQINVMQGRLTPHVLHFLTDTNSWFVSSKEYNDLKFKWRKRPEMEAADDFETKGSKHSIFLRISAGVTDWRGWFGSNP